MPSEPRVASAFGRRREPEVIDDDGADMTVLLPPIVLPSVRLRLEPEVDAALLEAVCRSFRDGIYAAARQGLADAVRDFAAEQEAATAEQEAATADQGVDRG